MRVISRSQLAKKIAQLFGGRVGADSVPQYFFFVQQWDRKDENDPHAVILSNDAAALCYAERTIAEMQMKKDYRDPAGLVIVRNEKNEVILWVPFLPACA